MALLGSPPGSRYRGVGAALMSNPESCISDAGEMRLRLARSEEHTSELQSPDQLVCRPPTSTRFPYTTLFRSLQTTRTGTNGPSDEKWGDYLTCRRHSPDGLTWIATGFTLQGGGSRSDVEPRVVHFGRWRDAAAVG